MRIRIEDIRSAGYCVRGARRWFQQHGLNFPDFLNNGIDADALIAAGDALAARVVQLKQERDGQG